MLCEKHWVMAVHKPESHLPGEISKWCESLASLLQISLVNAIGPNLSGGTLLIRAVKHGLHD